MKYKVVVVAVVCMLSMSCTFRSEFQIKTSPEFDITAAHTYTKSAARVSGKSENTIVFLIPVSSEEMKDAFDRAIKSYPGCLALVDGVETYYIFFLPPICLVQTLTIEGTCLVVKP